MTPAEHIAHAEHWTAIAEHDYNESAGTSASLEMALAIADTHTNIAYTQYSAGLDAEELTAEGLLND